ncbi:MAG: biotin--[Clostridia bacterium]|nr:biotin--[acetyl-CoA-carboxylase] ligase [Clostridia bacterium]
MVDIISVGGIENRLSTSLKSKLNITVKACSESTNNDVKSLARSGEPEGRVVVACAQTEGKGRLGRSFYSPDGTGVYMSVLLRPQLSPADVPLITTAAAVAVCIALEKAGVMDCGIKWVNDIYIGDKKVCGILAESGFNADGGVDYVVLGIGLNVYPPEGDFPAEIKDIAGAVFGNEQADIRNVLIGEILNSFFDIYSTITSRDHVEEYKKRCFLYGREVDVIVGDSIRRATVMGLDHSCGLQIEYDNGERATLTSGEVSLKLAK